MLWLYMVSIVFVFHVHARVIFFAIDSISYGVHRIDILSMVLPSDMEEQVLPIARLKLFRIT